MTKAKTETVYWAQCACGRANKGHAATPRVIGRFSNGMQYRIIAPWCRTACGPAAGEDRIGMGVPVLVSHVHGVVPGSRKWSDACINLTR
jgi:hypothetical protein